MNTQLAAILLARIENAALPWLDKTAGLVRVISYKHKVTGKTVTIPVAADVTDDLNCDASTLGDMLPDQRYRSVLFIESESQPRRTDDRTAMSWTGRFRVVVWIDCSKVGGGVGCGDVAYENLLSILENRTPFNSGPFRRVRITSVGGAPTRGREVFSKYTFDEERSQYVHFPFACFALDVEVSFSTVKGCEDELEEDNVNCWIPPQGPPRAWPRDLTCEQLNDPVTGLTDEQIEECLECAGTCVGVDILDNLGNVIAHVDDGDTYTVTPMILSFADETAALASSTVPTTAQMVVVRSTGRAYLQAGTSTVAQLVTAQSYLLPVTEISGNLETVVQGTTVRIQLNA